MGKKSKTTALAQHPGETVNDEAVMARRMKVWRLRTGSIMSYSAIAMQLGLPIETVISDAKAVAKEYLKVFNNEIQHYKMQQLEMLEHIIEESLKAWEKSKQPSNTATVKKIKQQLNEKTAKAIPVEVDALGNIVSVSEPEFPGEESTLKVSENPGDPRYLEAGLKGMADVRKLLGLDAPVRVTARDVKKLTDEELAALLEED